jgi:phosphoglycolate phosphatase
MKLILFDIDGTLVRTGGAGDRSLTRAFEVVQGIAGGMASIRPAGKTDPAIIREIYRLKLGRECTAHELEKVRDNYLEFLAEEVPRSSGYRVMPGIQELLAQLATNPDCLLGLVTGNLAGGAEIKLKRADLYKYFRFGGYSTDSEDRAELTRIGIERGKELAAQEFPIATIDKDDICVVGDTPYDIAAGKKVGAVTIAVATSHWTTDQLAEHKPDYLFKNLSDTEKFLEIVGL